MHWIRNRLENGKHAFFTKRRKAADLLPLLVHDPAFAEKERGRGCAWAAAMAFASAPGR
jgi:hypothetical protein